MAVQNTGDPDVFFDTVRDESVANDLITSQLDPTQPQVKGLDTFTNPLVPERYIGERLSNFDPSQFDLSDDSHLIRLLSALIGAGGLGALRRQMNIARMSSTLSGTNWLELDGFWGKLFSIPRDPATEALPVDASGSAINPASQVADSSTWDSIDSSDGRYRARIEQLAKGFANGGTYLGLYFAATAVLNSEVEIVESWNIADSITPGTSSFQANTYFAVSNQYPSYGAMKGHAYADLGGAVQNFGDTPTGNRGEIVILPGKVITDAERWVLGEVLNALSPTGTVVSISATSFNAQTPVAVRDAEADSNEWSIVSLTNQAQSLNLGSFSLYPNSTDYESARPGLAAYSGEKWTYNSQVSQVRSYSLLADDQPPLAEPAYETVVFSTGGSHDYLAKDALSDAQRLVLARAASDGILTTYPYAADRGNP